MINGALVVPASTDAEADRALLTDGLGVPHVDVGHGRLIFGMPLAEVALHPGGKNDRRELFSMCEGADVVAPRRGGPGVRSPI